MEDHPDAAAPQRRDYAKLTVREQVYKALDSERDYQDARRGNAAREKVEDNRSLGSLLTLIEVYLDKTKVAFAGPHPQGRVAAIEQLRKTVALGVLAMELNIDDVHPRPPA